MSGVGWYVVFYVRCYGIEGKLWRSLSVGRVEVTWLQDTTVCERFRVVFSVLG